MWKWLKTLLTPNGQHLGPVEVVYLKTDQGWVEVWRRSTMNDNDRKVVEIPTRAMSVHKRRLERKEQMRKNGDAVTRWALTDPTYDCSGATREQP